jgi:phosphoserine phosphatase RsbU/P
MRTTADGTFLRVNRTFAGWIDYEPDALVGRRKFQDLLSVGGRIFHQTHWAPLLAMQGSISEVKLELRKRDGSALPMVINAIVRQQQGQLHHELAAYVARDRDKYERELLSSRKRLEELVAETTRLHEEAKDRALFAEQMIGIVSHDLRNPISTVQTGAALLSRGSLGQGPQRLVERITRASQRANRLIGDLLDFTQARVGSGLSVALENVDLHVLIADAVDELALAHPDRSLLHVRQGSGDCRADAGRLEQLVGNLVSNALSYGDREKPITVSSSIESDHFAVAVHNHGAPIPSTTLPSLFQPMTRGVRASSSKRSVGLGLFIVAEISRAHGGTTQVQSNETAGTTFRCQFPRGS